MCACVHLTKNFFLLYIILTTFSYDDLDEIRDDS